MIFGFIVFVVFINNRSENYTTLYILQRVDNNNTHEPVSVSLNCYSKRVFNTLQLEEIQQHHAAMMQPQAHSQKQSVLLGTIGGHWT